VRQLVGRLRACDSFSGGGRVTLAPRIPERRLWLVGTAAFGGGCWSGGLGCVGSGMASVGGIRGAGVFASFPDLGIAYPNLL
jgi:hypothetical protein